LEKQQNQVLRVFGETGEKSMNISAKYTVILHGFDKFFVVCEGCGSWPWSYRVRLIHLVVERLIRLVAVRLSQLVVERLIQLVVERLIQLMVEWLASYSGRFRRFRL
jgi:hypothetical protein